MNSPYHLVSLPCRVFIAIAALLVNLSLATFLDGIAGSYVSSPMSAIAMTQIVTRSE